MVIYRCTYRSEDNWDEFLERIDYHIVRSLRFYNGLDLLPRFRPTVFDDKSQFDGASIATVREHFKQWASTTPQEEQGTGPGLAHRYRFCVYADEQALQSVINAEPQSLVDKSGFVKLINKDWQPDPEDDEGEEPIEGCTLHDVGWMMVGYQDVMVNMCVHLRESFCWELEYRRPICVVRA